MNPRSFRLVTVLVVALLAAGAYYGWKFLHAPLPNAPLAVTPAPDARVASTPSPPPVAEKGAIEHPLNPANPIGELPVLATPSEANGFFGKVLSGLLGQKNVLAFVQSDDFARRVAATVDNLGRSQAPSALWPVLPTPGRFVTLAAGGGTGQVISPDNDLRYSLFVQFVEAVDAKQAVALYGRLYPLLQRAYEDIGFPGRYFNDRLVAVIDLLLSVPVQARPLAVGLLEVRGSVPSLRPWVRYEFVDPALQSLSSGQKILLRTGPVNHRRLRAKLIEFRALVAGGGQIKAAEPASKVRP